MNNVIVSQVSASFLFFLVGFFLFFVVFDRFILHMWDGLLKKLVGYSSMVIFFVGPAILGWFTGLNQVAIIPLSILFIILIGEIHRHYMRWRYQHDSTGTEIQIIQSRSRITTQSLVLRRHEIIMEKWKGDPLRIAHISDLHVNGRLPVSFFEKCMDTIHQFDVDLLFLTGDYYNDKIYIPILKSIMQLAKARYGVYAILGNHEFYGGLNDIREIFRATGIQLLSGKQANVSIDSDRKVLIWGHESPWGKSADINQMANEDKGLKIALTHTPDNIFTLNRAGIDIVFAGHLHGGQWRFPGLGSLVAPSSHGRLFDHGRFNVRNTFLFVTAGLGNVWFPLRFRCEPEIMMIDVLSDQQAVKKIP